VASRAFREAGRLTAEIKELAARADALEAKRETAAAELTATKLGLRVLDAARIEAAADAADCRRSLDRALCDTLRRHLRGARAQLAAFSGTAAASESSGGEGGGDDSGERGCMEGAPALLVAHHAAVVAEWAVVRRRLGLEGGEAEAEAEAQAEAEEEAEEEAEMAARAGEDAEDAVRDGAVWAAALRESEAEAEEKESEEDASEEEEAGGGENGVEVQPQPEAVEEAVEAAEAAEDDGAGGGGEEEAGGGSLKSDCGDSAVSHRADQGTCDGCAEPAVRCRLRVAEGRVVCVVGEQAAAPAADAAEEEDVERAAEEAEAEGGEESGSLLEGRAASVAGAGAGGAARLEALQAEVVRLDARIDEAVSVEDFELADILEARRRAAAAAMQSWEEAEELRLAADQATASEEWEAAEELEQKRRRLLERVDAFFVEDAPCVE